MPGEKGKPEGCYSLFIELSSIWQSNDGALLLKTRLVNKEKQPSIHT